MRKINNGQTVSILANIGVIAGILFLVVELAQNNEFLGAQVRADRIDRQTRHIDTVAQDLDGYLLSNEGLADMFERSLTDYSTVEDADKPQLIRVVTSCISIYEYCFYSHEQGLMDDKLWEGWARSIETLRNRIR